MKKQRVPIYIHTHTHTKTKQLTLSSKNRRSQSALEYMMTYGWAILVIVIVAVILYSMGIFSPSSSITTTSTGFAPFVISSVVCSQAGLTVAVTEGGLPNNAVSATISKLSFQSNTGTTASINGVYNITPVTLSPGQSATFIVPTVACTSQGNPFSLSAKMQFSYSTTAGNVVTNSTGTIAGTSSSQSIAAYIPLTITSSVQTANPFQQLVSVNMSRYSAYASSNLQNVEFTYPNGTIIQSWRENGTSNNQTVVYWLKLGSFTTATVYMDFFSASSNVLNTVNTGEAPQLTCPNPSDTATCSTYAEYDNGVKVFNYYTNFAGTALPNGAKILDFGLFAASNFSYHINNGLTIITNSYWDQLQFPFNVTHASTAYTLSNFSYNSTVNSYGQTGIFCYEPFPNTIVRYFEYGGSTTQLNIRIANSTQNIFIGPNFGNVTLGKYYLYGLDNAGVGFYASVNNTNLYNESTVNSYGGFFGVLGSSSQGSTGPAVNYKYFLIRIDPPGSPVGIMPTVSFGSIQ